MEEANKVNSLQVDEFAFRYESENKKIKTMESDLEKLNTLIKDKEKIIGLYEFMLNNNNHASTISDAR